MKNQAFRHRFRYALAGIKAAWQAENSFRAQAICGLLVVLVLIMLRPEPVWWALLLLTTGAVLAAELLNTALEHVMDRLHPEQHPMIARAKDCAAGAVLLLSLVAVAVFGAFLVNSYLSFLGPV
jgi:undecaprenol kinase